MDWLLKNSGGGLEGLLLEWASLHNREWASTQDDSDSPAEPIGSDDAPLSGVEPKVRRRVGPEIYLPRSFSSTFVPADPESQVLVSVSVELVEEEPFDRPVIRELKVRVEGDRGLDRQTLLSIPAAEFLRDACADHAVQVSHDGRPSAGSRVEAQVHTTMPRRRRTRMTDEHLQQVADIYRSHEGHAPTQAVASRLHLAHSTAAKHVMRARERGLLPQTTGGQATNREDGT